MNAISDLFIREKDVDLNVRIYNLLGYVDLMDAVIERGITVNPVVNINYPCSVRIHCKYHQYRKIVERLEKRHLTLQYDKGTGVALLVEIQK